MNNTVKQPIITTTLAAGSVASPYSLLCNITQQLCYKACTSTTPVFAPSFTLKQIVSVGTGAYVALISVQGIISYNKCGSTDCSCCTQQPLSAVFSVPFASTTAPSDVTITASTPIVALTDATCSQLSRQLVCECVLTLTVS
jgi:hypothetical protein